MGAYGIPWQHPPQQNPMQSAEQGQQAALSAQAMMQQEGMRQQQQQALAQEQRLREQQIDQAAIQTQQMQQQQRDQQLMRGVLQGWDPSEGGNGLLNRAIKAGVSPAGSTGIANTISTVRKNAATADLDQLKGIEAKHADERGLLTAIQQAEDPAQRQRLAAQALQTIPGITPEAIAPEAIQHTINSLKVGDWALAEAKDAATNREKAAQTARASAETENLKAQKPGIMAKAAAEDIAVTTQKMAALAQHDRDAYIQAKQDLASASPEKAALFPDPPDEGEYDGQKFAQDVSLVGTTPEQRQTNALRLAQSEARVANWKELRRQGNTRIEQGWERLTKGSASERLANQKEYNALINEEDTLDRQRNQLGTALAKKNIYIQPNGTPKTLSTDANEKQSQIEDMQARYNSLTDQRVRTLGRKNELIVAGGGVPSISTAEGERAIRNPQPAAPPPAQTTPAPKAVQGAQPKPATAPAAKYKYTEAQIRQRAAAEGIDPNALVSKARANKLIP